MSTVAASASSASPERDVTTSVANSLAGTSQTAPVFFLNPDNGVSYAVVAQTPEYRVASVSDLANIPVTAPPRALPIRCLAGSAASPAAMPPPWSRTIIYAPVVDIFATPNGRDLGAVAGDINRVLKALEGEAPKGVTVTMRGQYETMNNAFSGLAFG